MRGMFALVVLAACGSAADPPVLACDPPRGPAFEHFRDVTATSGVDFVYATPDFKGAGLAVADLDGDGLPEIVAGRRIGGLVYYRNRGGLQFEEVTGSGLDPAWAASALAASDLDNDGDLDLVVAGPGVAHVMTNQGDGTFVEAARFDDSGVTEHVLPVDLDGDGLLDLYFSNYDLTSAFGTLNRTFMNQGGMQFAFAGAAGGGRSWSATALDLDGDGDQDLYVANDTLLADFGGPPEMSTLPVDLVLRNDGASTDGTMQYTDLAPALGFAEPRSSMGGLYADFNDDGLLDIFVPNFGAKKVFLRDAAGGFVESAPALGLSAIARDNAACPPGSEDEDCLVLSWSAAQSDFDLDGFDEIVLVNGATRFGDPPPVVMFTRGAEPTYHEVSPDLACLDARALAVTDLDGDGDQDLVIGQKAGPLVVYETRGTPATTTWLRVQLHGQTSNREGIGAIVTVHLTSGRAVTKAVGAGGVIHSSSPAEAFFGVGSDEVDSVDVRWPSGRRTQVLRPAAPAIVVDET